MSSGMLVEYARMLDLLAFEGQLLTAATHDAHADSLVAGVPRRTLGETVRDLGDFCEDTLSWLGAAEAAQRDSGLPNQASLREIRCRFTARLADLLAELGTRPPEDPCPTWSPDDGTVAFWLRRTLHTTIASRVDVQTAAGVEVTPIESDVALDGIDEVLRLWLGYRLTSLGVTATQPCSILVHVAEQGWLVDATRENITVIRVNESNVDPDREVNAVVGGDPAAVYLWLWGRVPDRAIDITGDQNAVAQLWGLLRLATQ